MESTSYHFLQLIFSRRACLVIGSRNTTGIIRANNIWKVVYIMTRSTIVAILVDSLFRVSVGMLRQKSYQGSWRVKIKFENPHNNSTDKTIIFANDSIHGIQGCLTRRHTQAHRLNSLETGVSAIFRILKEKDHSKNRSW